MNMIGQSNNGTCSDLHSDQHQKEEEADAPKHCSPLYQLHQGGGAKTSDTFNILVLHHSMAHRFGRPLFQFHKLPSGLNSDLSGHRLIEQQKI
eukprot:5401111-Amphidinium_carterae.1